MVLFSKKANIAPQKSLVERQKFTIIHPVHYGRGLARILLATGLIILILASIPIASNPIASLPAIYGATQLSDAHGPMPQETARPGCTELIINGDFELLGPE